MEIKDSGSRKQFESGAVRDIDESKGRCDLMPLDCVAYLFDEDAITMILVGLNEYIYTGNINMIPQSIKTFAEYEGKHMSTLMLDVSQHYKNGCVKYGERNWEKGIPLHSYIDSAVRHLLKHVRGDDDEPHDIAFVWNLMCCYHTQLADPTMADLPFAKSVYQTIMNAAGPVCMCGCADCAAEKAESKDELEAE